MIGLAEIRAIALDLPHVEEGGPVPAARRIATFKVAGKSFIGLERGGRTMTASLTREEAQSIAARNPQAYEDIWRNGEVFMGLRVDLAAVSLKELRELIEASWRHCGGSRTRIAQVRRGTSHNRVTK